MSKPEKTSFRQRLSRVLYTLAENLEKENIEKPKHAKRSRKNREIVTPDATEESRELVSVSTNDTPPLPKTRRIRPRRQRSLRQKEKGSVEQKSFQLAVSATLKQSVQHSWQIFQNLRQKPRFWLWMGLGIGIGTSTIALGWGVNQLESSVQYAVEEVLTYAPEETITIVGMDGEILQTIGPVTYDPLKIWQIPDPVLQAFIASEDRRFEEHKGVDFQGILRAAFANVKAGGVVEGGSTITQQLARIVFLNQERSMTRKLKEVRLSQKVEQKLTKAEILERYLNLVYLGSGAYGISDAAWVYFGKTVDQLTLPEMATLAGIVPAPSVYSPIQNPKAAKERRDLVINRMLEDGMITDAEAQKAIASPVTVNPKQPKRLIRQAPYFTDYVLQEVKKVVPEAKLQQGGVVIETTLNPQWQKEAKEVVEGAVKRYGRGYRFSQASLTSIDPRTGQIKAMVGGIDFEKNQFNRVTQAKRQPGSTFKTFVYSTAIAAGFSPNQSFLNAEYFVDGYKPENYGDTYSGKYVSMRQALASSLNVVAVKTLVDVGWNPVIQVARKMGIQSELQPTYSLALGSWEVNLLELTSAYGTLANKGVHNNAYGVSRVLDRKGNVLYQAKLTSKEALDAESSAITTWMLQGVVNSGTGTAAQIGRPVAGKTGTSDKARDLWFVGYIPQLVTGIWLGNDNNSPTYGGSNISAMLWRQYMLDVTENLPIESFPAIPNRLEGRKATLKKEPIKPKKAYYKMPEPQESASGASDTNSSASRSRSYQRQSYRSRSVTQPQSPPPRSSRRRSYSSSPPSSSANRPKSTTPKTTAPTAPASAPAPTAPSVNTAPPAPPAARKGE